jgi:ubiquinone/menaquinone biosynthesis C-methylase UbiE
MSIYTENWWRKFFESPDSLPISCFPEPETTAGELNGIEKLLDLHQQMTIADICCGYGRHALPLKMRGYDVIGLDISEMMLHVGGYRAQQVGVNVPMVRGLAQQLPFANDAFEVILNLFNSLGYMAEEENRTVLKETARCLKPGGRFMLETRNKKFQILFAPHSGKMDMADGEPARVSSTYDAETSRLDTVWTNPDDETEVYHTASIRLYSPEEIEGMLDDAGLCVDARLGNYAGDGFQGFERQLIYLCTRR